MADRSYKELESSRGDEMRVEKGLKNRAVFRCVFRCVFDVSRKHYISLYSYL